MHDDEYQQRIIAVKQYLEGEQPMKIYTSLRRSAAWFYKGKTRYELHGLEGLRSRSPAPKSHSNQTPEALESVIVNIRRLRERRETADTKYALIGAFAIHKELRELGDVPPSVRTIHNLLTRHGFVGSPPPTQPLREVIDRHYPAVSITAPGELQQLDLVGPRSLKDSPQKDYFYNLRDVYSRRVALEVRENRQAVTIVNALIRVWQRMGLPKILQHDNAAEFRGSPRYARSIGLLTKLCLALDIESLFIPVRQPYRNGTIENFNGLFQRLVLKIQTIDSLAQLQQEVKAFEVAANTQHPHIPLNGQTSDEFEYSFDFVPVVLPTTFTFSSQFTFPTLPVGKISFICRVRKNGKITVASETFSISPDLAWDYVYATIAVKEQKLTIYHKAELIKEFSYELQV